MPQVLCRVDLRKNSPNVTGFELLFKKSCARLGESRNGNHWKARTYAKSDGLEWLSGEPVRVLFDVQTRLEMDSCACASVNPWGRFFERKKLEHTGYVSQSHGAMENYSGRI